MAKERITFFDLIPFSTIVEKYVKSPEQLKEIFVAGIRQKALFYVVNQADKYVHMIRWGYEELEEPPHERRFYEAEKRIIFARGDMLPITSVYQFDRLFKGVLNEIDLFVDIDGLDELIEYQQSDHLFKMHADNEMLTAPSDFMDVRFEHVFIRACDLKSIDDLMKAGPKPKETKQDQREKVFVEWLKDKDRSVVANMKKDHVWEELRKIDQRLFGVEPKNFFRDQKIITFKSGRKPS